MGISGVRWVWQALDGYIRRLMDMTGVRWVIDAQAKRILISNFTYQSLNILRIEILLSVVECVAYHFMICVKNCYHGNVLSI